MKLNVCLTLRHMLSFVTLQTTQPVLWREKKTFAKINTNRDLLHFVNLIYDKTNEKQAKCAHFCDVAGE